MKFEWLRVSNIEDNGTDYTVAVDCAEFREFDISTGMFLSIAQKDGKKVAELVGQRNTDFPAGVIKVIPIVLHQWVERIVGPVLITLAFASMTEETQIARAFFVAMGIIIFAVERLTAYRSTTD